MSNFRKDYSPSSSPPSQPYKEASVGLGVHIKVQSLPLNVTLVNPFVLLLQALLEAPLCLSVVHSCRTHRVKWSGQSWANAILWHTRVLLFDVPTFVSTIHNMSWLCCKLNGWIMLETYKDHAFSLNNYWELCWKCLEMVCIQLCGITLLQIGQTGCHHVYEMNKSHGRCSINKHRDK